MSSPLLSSSSSSSAPSSASYRSMDSHSSVVDSDSVTVSLSAGHSQIETNAFTLNNKPIHLILTQQSITYTVSSGGRSVTHSLADLLGCLLSDSASLLTLNFYPLPTSKCCKSADRVHEAWELETSDETAAKSFYSAIQNIVHGLPLEGKQSSQSPSNSIPRRHIYLLVNPASGSGKALENARSIEPMLKQSGVSYQFILTTHAGHAEEFLLTLNIDEYDAISIVCSSGDGLIHEAVNGLFKRSDWQRAVDRVTFGTIGGGSGNGLAKNLTETSGEVFSPVNAAFIAIKGYSRPMDLFSVLQPGQAPRFGFLSVSWAIVSDIDFESEKWRCCGGARFTFAALWTMFCNLNRYQAELSILHPPLEASAALSSDGKRSVPQLPKCEESRECSHCMTQDQREVNEMANYLDRIRGDLENPGKARRASENKSEPSSSSKSRSPALSAAASPEPHESWETITDSFTVIWAMNVPYAATDMLPAPMAHCSDGLLDLVFLREIGSCSLLGFMLKIENGQHIDSDRLEYVKCKGMRLKATDPRPCVMGVDGERLPESEVEVRCWRGVLKVHAK